MTYQVLTEQADADARGRIDAILAEPLEVVLNQTGWPVGLVPRSQAREQRRPAHATRPSQRLLAPPPAATAERS